MRVPTTVPIETVRSLKARTAALLANAAPDAARYLRDIADGTLNGTTRRLEVAKFIINHAIGMPRAKVDIDDNTESTTDLDGFTVDELNQLLDVTTAKEVERAERGAAIIDAALADSPAPHARIEERAVPSTAPADSPISDESDPENIGELWAATADKYRGSTYDKPSAT